MGSIKEIRESLRQYVAALGIWGWVVISCVILGEIVTIVLFTWGLLNAPMPEGTDPYIWSFFSIVILGLVAVPFIAFHRLRISVTQENPKPKITFSGDDEIHGWSAHYRLSALYFGAKSNIEANLIDISPYPEGLRTLPIPMNIMDHGRNCQVVNNKEIKIDLFQVLGKQEKFQGSPQEVPASEDYPAKAIKILDANRSHPRIPFQKYEFTLDVSCESGTSLQQVFTFEPLNEWKAKISQLEEATS